jgi:hypothetical protein
LRALCGVAICQPEVAPDRDHDTGSVAMTFFGVNCPVDHVSVGDADVLFAVLGEKFSSRP